MTVVHTGPWLWVIRAHDVGHTGPMTVGHTGPMTVGHTGPWLWVIRAHVGHTGP